MGMSNIFVNAMKTTQQWMPGQLTRKRQEIASNSTRRAVDVVTVGKMMKTIQPVPSHSILLGQCTDGKPFLMGLSDPELGAVLVSGDPGCGKTHQLQVMADSAIRAHTPRALQISILTSKPDEWAGLQNDPHKRKYLQDVCPWYNGQAEKIIQVLTELAEARRQGQRQGAWVLFVLDDTYIENLSYEAQVNLHWLLAYGSQTGVWVIGTINAGYADSFRYWIETFRTRITGRVQSNENAEILTMRPESHVENLSPGTFRIWTGMDWVTHRLLPLGD